MAQNTAPNTPARLPIKALLSEAAGSLAPADNAACGMVGEEVG